MPTQPWLTLSRALAAARPGGAVDELAGAGHPLGPLHVVDVVVLRVARLDADGPRRPSAWWRNFSMITFTPLRVVKPSLPAVIGIVRASLPLIVTVIVCLLDVDVGDDRLADGEVDLAAGRAPDVAAGVDALGVDVDGHLGAGRPVVLRAVVDLLAVHPVPGALDRDRGGHLQPLLDRGAVLDRVVPEDLDRQRDADGLTVQRGDRGLQVPGRLQGLEGRADRHGRCRRCSRRCRSGCTTRPA